MSRGLHHHAERRETGNFKGKERNVGTTESWQQSLARFHDWHTVGPLSSENRGKTKVSRQAKAMNLETVCLRGLKCFGFTRKSHLASVH